MIPAPSCHSEHDIGLYVLNGIYRQALQVPWNYLVDGLGYLGTAWMGLRNLGTNSERTTSENNEPGGSKPGKISKLDKNCHRLNELCCW